MIYRSKKTPSEEGAKTIGVGGGNSHLDFNTLKGMSA